MTAREIVESRLTESDEEDRDRYWEPEGPRKCPHCTGGRVDVEGGRAHYCMDCNGSGLLPDSDRVDIE